MVGLAGLALRRPRVAGAGLAAWAAGTTELAVARIVPGPRTPAEIGAGAVGASGEPSLLNPA